MSLFRRAQPLSGSNPIPPPGARPLTGSVRVTNETAMRHSAVWAALRLRANLISTMPVDVYRPINGVRVSVATPPVLRSPGGDRVDIQEWLYSTQVDLDRSGNCFGVITEKNALGLPARIDLVQLGEVSVSSVNGELSYRFGGTTYKPEDVWHEKQYTIAGLDVGLSPVAFAAWSIGSYLSAQDFALGWFGNAAIPAAELVNTEKTLNQREAQVAKTGYEAAVRSGGLFVHGKDWELKPMQAVDSQTQFLETMQYGIPDIARFFDCPADLIDGAVSGQAVTYANISQRNLQLLIMHLGPPIMRREKALTRLVPGNRYVKLNRAALLAMDPATQATTIHQRLADKTLTNPEARALYDAPPLTDEDMALFDRLYGAARTTPTEAKA
ncbi:phage portal protein [Micromonospora sp. WMMD1076]|uniref:phage portal protein n=1 Tax=Micromonospora sp. WMMD1076 TaxID=3016103 RepID=UPI00249CDFE3|nr:phage portal protein [Micromonospora sp. WMMD1076]WFF07245.1 phage portal protein [Micromonospora sp. WMMD1076]